MHRVTSRAVNSDVRNHNNVAKFLFPVGKGGPNPVGITLSNAPYAGALLVSDGLLESAATQPKLLFTNDTNNNTSTLSCNSNLVVRGTASIGPSLSVSGGIHAETNFSAYGSADISGNLTVGQLFTCNHNSIVRGTLAVGPSLSVDGGIHAETNFSAYGSADISGNLIVGGTISPGHYLPGQHIKTVILSASDLGLSGQTTINSATTGTVANYNYTPGYNSSYIIVEYFTVYTLGGNSGGGTDSVTSHMYVNSSPISNGYQQWLSSGSPANVAGVGTRSGTIFPLLGRYTNSSPGTIPVLITVFSQGDTLVINNDNGTWLKITEIAR